MVDTQRSRVWWVHRGVGYGGYTEEQGMVGTQRSRVWWVHRGAGYGGYTAILHVHISYMYDTFWYDNTHVHDAGCIHSYNALTSSLVLISAPLSSKSTTVAVWPSFDARRSKTYIYSTSNSDRFQLQWQTYTNLIMGNNISISSSPL